jgi:polyphosphate kinase
MGKALKMKRMLYAPFTLKKGLLDLIAREAANAAAGKKAEIVCKINAITDAKVIRALYRASQAGVKVELIVRGMCCLRAGIPGVSQNIRVRSVVGRFLEHSRVYWFLNDGEPDLYLASADLMERNLDRRVETCFPIEGKKLKQRVRRELDAYLTDNHSAWMQHSDGSYVLTQPATGQPVRDAQMQLLERFGGVVAPPSA